MRSSDALVRPKGDDCLVCIYGGPIGKRFILGQTETTIGRGKSCSIVVEHSTVSRKHAGLSGSRGQRIVEDLGSTNGVYINGVLDKQRVLQSGDYIKIGDVIFKYLAGDNIESIYHEEIYRLAIEDGLTRIPNKRAFDAFLEREFARAVRYSRPLSLMMIDIDRFKQINDQFGHVAGDHVLSEMAGLLKPRIRRDECFARYGGEEFSIVMPESELVGAARYAEIIRAHVDSHKFVFEGCEIPMTISIGVAQYRKDMKTPEALVQAADKCLLRAKELGRNQVVLEKQES
ncbi:MAG: GGDEF domain-containing protein [Myxococcales bacterium]|nr:GGDEF domain-containing protein [Myxococcales bacterium]